MKTLTKVAAASALVLFGALSATPALADWGHGHGHGGVRFGISFGVPVYGPRFYPAPYYPYPYAYPAPVYAYPPVVVQSSPPVYIEQPPAQSAPAPAPTQAQGDWYYCAASKSYYPYVSACPTGWERVPAQPPAQ